MLMTICQAALVPEESSAFSQTHLFVIVLLGKGWGPFGDIWKAKSGLWWEELGYVEYCWSRQSSCCDCTQVLNHRIHAASIAPWSRTSELIQSCICVSMELMVKSQISAVWQGRWALTLYCEDAIGSGLAYLFSICPTHRTAYRYMIRRSDLQCRVIMGEKT